MQVAFNGRWQGTKDGAADGEVSSREKKLFTVVRSIGLSEEEEEDRR